MGGEGMEKSQIAMTNVKEIEGVTICNRLKIKSSWLQFVANSESYTISKKLLPSCVVDWHACPRSGIKEWGQACQSPTIPL